MKNLIFDRGRVPILLALITLFAVGVGWFFHKHNFGGLGPESLDSAQIARNISQGHGFSTSILQPQITEAFSSLAGRDFVPDLTHAPLYPVVLGAVFAFVGESDRNVVALSLALYVLSAALLFVLVRRLSDNLLLAALSAIVFCLSLPVLSVADSGQPQALSVVLLLLLVVALSPKADKAAPEPRTEPEPRMDEEALSEEAFFEEALSEEEAPSPEELREEIIPIPASRRLDWSGFGVGICLALCYLNDYFSLCYALPLVLLWKRDASPWKRSAVLAFGFGFALLAVPWWVRNFRLTGNPFYSLQWNFWASRVGGIDGIVALFLQSFNRFFFTLATIPHLYLMPFIVVSAWLSYDSEFPSRRRTATLTALTLAILTFSVFGRSNVQELVPLAPLLTLLGVSSFLQIVGSRIPSPVGQALVLPFSVALRVKVLNFLRLGMASQELIDRSRHEALQAQAAGDAYLHKGRWPIRRVRQARGLALLLPILALPLLFLPPQPPPDGTAVVLMPLSKVVAKNRVIATDIPQQVAWYSARKTMPLPERVTQLVDTKIETPSVRNVGGIYLSDQMRTRAGQNPDSNWLNVYAQSSELPGYQKVPLERSRNLLYLKQPSTQEARSLVKSNPKSSQAYVALGSALLQQRQFQQALSAFLSAAQKQPRAGEALVGAGMANLALGNNADAAAQFKGALAISPRAIPALMGLAQTAQAGEKSEGAISLYERVLAESPDNPIALNNLAQLYADQNRDLHRALEMAKRALSRNPNNPAMLDTLSSVFQRLGYGPEAIRALQQAVQVSPQNTKFRQRLKTLRGSQ